MKSVKLSLIIFVIILAGIFLFWSNLTNLYFQNFFKLPQIEKGLTGLTEKIEKQITTPNRCALLKKRRNLF